MSYKDKFGITNIKEGKNHNLSVSWDYEDNPEDLSQRKAVFLFSPNFAMSKDHYHIELNRCEALQLKVWLNSFLEDTDNLI